MFGTYLGSGVTVQYDFGTTVKKNDNAKSFIIYFEQTVQNKFPARCENTKYYIKL